MKPLLALLLLSAGAGCGGAMCDDPSVRMANVNSCVSGGSPLDYCACGVDRLMEAHSCGDVNNGTHIEATELVEICRTCGGGC